MNSIAVAPIVLGSGRALFGQAISSKKLNLISTQQLATGGVILKYSNE